MNRFAIATATGAAALAASACTNLLTADDARPESTTRAALSELGIADTIVRGDRVAMLDASGAEIGELAFDSNGGMVSRLGLHTARMTASPDGMSTMSVDCDGRTLALAGSSGRLEGDASNVVAPCRSALRLASIWLGHDVVPASDHAQLLACYSDHIDGCVSWEATRGCTLMMYCFVEWCDDGFSDYQCSIE